MAKVAILIDGRFFLERLKIIFPNGYQDESNQNFDIKNPLDVAKMLVGLIKARLVSENRLACEENSDNLLYRVFFYDAPPYAETAHFPISQRGINYAKTPQAKFSLELHELLRTTPSIALRLGQIKKTRGWVLKENKQKEIIKRLREGETLTLQDLNDDDFSPEFKQRAVDMRIGMDIATLTLKKLVSTIVLITGDSDFIPAAKLARVEGIKFKIDILGQEISKDLLEHVDEIYSSFRKPSSNYLPHLNW
jgi:uncharacterized LabA/DUF88 family protein